MPPSTTIVDAVSKAADTSELEGVDPKEGILLLKGSALKKFATHQQYGKLTSHEILARLKEEYICQGGREVEPGVWAGGPSQVVIMRDLHMFEPTDFFKVNFEDLPRNKKWKYCCMSYTNPRHKRYTVWTYCWADSPWGEMWTWVERTTDPYADQECYWFDIFCLDQFHPNKMETIKRSNDIYQNAFKYRVIGLACFERLWCLAEVGCKQGNQIYLVTDGACTGFLYQRERAYKVAKLKAQPTFQDSRCTVVSDRDIVRERILQKFDSIESFNIQIMSVADDHLEAYRREDDDLMGWYRDDPSYLRDEARSDFTFCGATDKPHVCKRCAKLEHLHHGLERWCYDFLLDYDVPPPSFLPLCF